MVPISSVGYGGVLLVFVLLAIGAPLVLWYLVEREAEDVETLDRESAERAARRDERD